MANATILHSSLLDGAGVVVTATNARSTLPAANLLEPSPSEKLGCIGTSTVIDIDLGVAGAARQLVLGGLGDAGFTGLSTFTLVAGTSAGDSSALSMDGLAPSGSQLAGVDPIYGQSLLDFGATVSARYWRLTLTGTGVTDLQIGRILLGPVLDIETDDGTDFNIAYPIEVTERDFDQHLEMIGGHRHSYQHGSLRVATLTYGDGIGSASVWGAIMRTLRLAKRGGRQVAVTIDPADAVLGVNQLVLGRVSSPLSAVVSDYALRGASIEITEDA